MAFQDKKFLDAEGITHLVRLLDEYPNNQVLGTVIDAIEEELEQKAEKSEITDLTNGKADKNGTVLTSTLSRGRKAGTVIGGASFAFGYNVEASGGESFAEGTNTVASGNNAHAEGGGTVASGLDSHAQGWRTIANHRSQTVIGECNVEDPSTADSENRGTYIEIVGNGTAANARSNARTLDWNGNEVLAGTITANGVNLNDEINDKLDKPSIAGTSGQVLTSDGQGGQSWETPDVTDVQVNGTSMVSNGVANVPVITGQGQEGAVRIYNRGFTFTNDPFDNTKKVLAINIANSNVIKKGSSWWDPIVPVRQHESVFYGLATAAGDTTQSASSNAVGVYTDSAKTAIKNMLGITQTLTVTVLTQDNVTVTGQTVTVRAVDSTGPIFATAAYEGQPVAFSVPSGFAYHVSVSDTLDHHFNPTTASGIITNTDVSVTLQYSDFSTIRTARDIKAALNAGLDLTDLVGEQITCSKSNDTLTWDVVDYDSTTGKIKLLLHDAFGTANMVFEPAQALMWCENGLAAGDYTFADGSTHYYFTLTNAIPAGGQLRADPSSFWTYASQSATSTIETGTVSTTEITSATDLGTCAQGLLNHMSRVRYGSNNQAESAIQWWMNTDAPAGTLRTPVTKFSRAYSYNVPGFMYGLDQDFVDCLDDVSWLCSTNNVYECPEELGGYTKGIRQAYTINAKFCFASEMEIFGSYDGNPDGSTVFDLYNGADADDRKKYRGTSVQVWWLRSPYWNYAHHERGVSSSGGAHNYYASYSYAVVPACQISRDSEVTE